MKSFHARERQRAEVSERDLQEEEEEEEAT
jgi:hypothetical protein